MMNKLVIPSTWTQKAYVLAGTLAIAAAINLVLLLLIASLVSYKSERIPPPTLRPIDFIRLPPKPKPPEPKKEPPKEEKIIEKKVEPPPKVEHKPPPKKPPKKVKRKTKKVAAPKLDIPLSGSGAALTSIAGQDSRVTAPPTKWDVEEAPKIERINSRLVPVSRVMPTYPWRAKRMGVEGWVKLEVIVATDGSVSEINIIEGKPSGIFNEAASKAMRQWRFKPAFVNGQAVEQRAIQLMEFRLK